MRNDINADRLTTGRFTNPYERNLEPSSSSVTSRSRNDVVHRSRIHKTRPYSSHHPTSELHINFHHGRIQERTFEGGTRCFVRTVLAAVVMEVRRLNLRVWQMEMGYQQCHGE